MIYGEPTRFKREEFVFKASIEQTRSHSERFEIVMVFENNVYVGHRTQRDYSDRDQPHLSAIQILELNKEILDKVKQITLELSNSQLEQQKQTQTKT